MPASTNQPIEKITIYGFGPTTASSSNEKRSTLVVPHLDASPFVMKVLSFAMYNDIPFTFNAETEFSPMSGRVPWMKIDWIDLGWNQSNPKPTIIEDSQQCILELTKLYKNVDMDSHLTQVQKIQSETLRLLVENVLYQTLVRSTWVDHPEFIIENVPLPLPDFAKSFLVRKFLRKNNIEMLNVHGNGDLSNEEYHNVAANIYKEISRILGSKKFLFSDQKPSVIDCVLIRYFDNVHQDYYTPEAVKRIFEEDTNLAAYSSRIRELLLPDSKVKRLMEEGKKSQLIAKQRGTTFFNRCLGGIFVGMSLVIGFGMKKFGYF